MQVDREASDFYHPRDFLREPIQALWDAASILDEAVTAYIKGKDARANYLIAQANLPIVREWTESLWGGAKNSPDHLKYVRLRTIDTMPARLSKTDRVELRMPDARGKQALIERYGHQCAFCGLPVIRAEVRREMHLRFPEALPWGRTNQSQHAAFQCLWLQFDHILPHAYGGDNSLSNIVITCAPCNYGRGDRLLEEVGLNDPRQRSYDISNWDGLERFLHHRRLAGPR